MTRGARLAALAAIVFGGMVTNASAYTVASGWKVTDFATGFMSASGVGPTGPAMDPQGKLYVSNDTNGNIYAFGPSGGVASASTQANSSPLLGPVDLAFTPDGRLYATQEGAPKDVVELNPATGAVIRQVASGLPHPAGLAVDPLTGDLFVSEYVGSSGGRIDRIENPGSATPTVVPGYATGLSNPDGMAFGTDGTLYVSENVATGGVWAIQGTNSVTPGDKTMLTTLNVPDGIVVGSDFLLVNANDGNVWSVALSSPHIATNIVSGGSRGDIATVGSDGCGYFTQSDLVFKLTNSDGTCSLTPTVRFTRTLTVARAGTGSGTVTGSGISCPGTCSAHFASGSSVTLTATPAAGSSFAGWRGACAGTGLCHLTIRAPQTVTAIFTAAKPRPAKCGLVLASRKVLLPGGKKHKAKPARGVLSFRVRCDQPARVKLTGTLLTKQKRKHAKPLMSTFHLGPSSSTLKAGKKATLTLRLPKAALRALAKGASASAVFSLTASNVNGRSITQLKVPRLRAGH